MGAKAFSHACAAGDADYRNSNPANFTNPKSQSRATDPVSKPIPAAPTEGVGNANVAIGPALAATPANLPTRPATAPPPLTSEALPDNVFPLRCYSKFFHSGREDDSV